MIVQKKWSVDNDTAVVPVTSSEPAGGQPSPSSAPGQPAKVKAGEDYYYYYYYYDDDEEYPEDNAASPAANAWKKVLKPTFCF